MPRLDPDQLLEGLDPEQAAVATSVGIPVVVVAGAGTGKTRAITHRIAYGAATGALDPRATLAVTFTTRAAGELRGRLAAFGVPEVAARTFHAAALRQAQYFWPRTYGSELPEVTDSRYAIVAEVVSSMKLPSDTALIRDLVSEVSWAKVGNVAPDAYPALAERANRRVGNLTPDQVAAALTRYDEVLRRRGRIDFDDILLCTVALLSEHEHVAQQVRRTYRHLVIDEYQDVSPIQQRLVDLWLGPGRDICVVGDPAQTIHGFAGARSEYLEDFQRRHTGARRIELFRDYRSTPQVVSVANQVMASDDRTHVTLTAVPPDGPAVSFVGAKEESAEATHVATWLQGLHSQGVPWGEMAVLYRINAMSPAFEMALSERGVPYRMRNADRFYDRPEIRQALAAMAATARTEAELDGLPRIRSVLSALGWTSEAPAGAGRVRERWESQQALLDLAVEIDAAAEMNLGDIVAALQQRASLEHEPAGAAVTLATLHSAKGLEWDAVALVGIHDGGVPFVLATTDDQLAEERRLLYVGITRARQHLRISWSQTKTGSGATRPPSRFLAPVVPSAGVDSAKRRRERKRRSKDMVATTCRVCEGSLSSSAERILGRHEDCESSYNEDVLAALKTWRSTVSKSANVPAYVVFTDATLMAIAEAMPANESQLLEVSGVGPNKIDKYADDVLALVAAATDDR